MINVVFAVDHRFEVPLRTALASIAAHASDTAALRVWVATDRDETAGPGLVSRVRAACGLDVRWLPIHASAIAEAPVIAPWTRATYLRLLLAGELPVDVDRFIYLDADVIVEADLASLARCDLGDSVLGAVRSFRRPPRGGPVDFRRHPYFNAGVLVVDRRRWLDQDITARAMDCIARHPEGLRTMDQDVLNATLAGRWAALDRRWNQQASVWELSHRALGISSESLQVLRSRPFIIHFSGLVKPWHYGDDHPLRERFAHYSRLAGIPPLRPSPASFVDVVRRAAKAVIPRSCRPMVRRALIGTKHLARAILGRG